MFWNNKTEFHLHKLLSCLGSQGIWSLPCQLISVRVYPGRVGNQMESTDRQTTIHTFRPMGFCVLSEPNVRVFRNCAWITRMLAWEEHGNNTQIGPRQDLNPETLHHKVDRLAKRIYTLFFFFRSMKIRQSSLVDSVLREHAVPSRPSTEVGQKVTWLLHAFGCKTLLTSTMCSILSQKKHFIAVFFFCPIQIYIPGKLLRWCPTQMWTTETKGCSNTFGGVCIRAQIRSLPKNSVVLDRCVLLVPRRGKRGQSNESFCVSMLHKWNSWGVCSIDLF